MTSNRRDGKGWIWFMAALAVLSLAAISINIWYNLGQQLKPEQLAAAQALWDAKGPRDYDLEYVQTGENPATFVTKVRGGRAVSVTRDGVLLESRLFPDNDMNALFSYVERFLQMDAQPGHPRVYTRALFDAEDGHIVRYVRSIFTTKYRLEWNVTLRKVTRAAEPHGADSEK